MGSDLSICIKQTGRPDNGKDEREIPAGLTSWNTGTGPTGMLPGNYFSLRYVVLIQFVTVNEIIPLIDCIAGGPPVRSRSLVLFFREGSYALFICAHFVVEHLDFPVFVELVRLDWLRAGMARRIRVCQSRPGNRRSH